jgi:hypothetical protein
MYITEFNIIMAKLYLPATAEYYIPVEKLYYRAPVLVIFQSVLLVLLFKRKNNFTSHN